MKRKKLKSIRNKLIELYNFSREKEVHHAAWFSATQKWSDLQKLVEYSEPYLVSGDKARNAVILKAAGFSTNQEWIDLRENIRSSKPLISSESYCEQNPPIKMETDLGKMLHVFFGDNDLLRRLEKACFGFASALVSSKLLPEIKLPEELNQTNFDLLHLAALIYSTADNEQSLIDDTGIEYQLKAGEFYFEYINTFRRQESFSLAKCFFGSPIPKQAKLPPGLGIYTEANFIRMAIESLDFQLFVLPELKEATLPNKRNTAKFKLTRSQRERLNLFSELIFYWIKNLVPPTLKEMAKEFRGSKKEGAAYSEIRRAIKFKYPDDNGMKRFQHEYLSGELIRVLLTDQVYEEAKLPSDVKKLRSGKWDDQIRNAASFLPLMRSDDINI